MVLSVASRSSSAVDRVERTVGHCPGAAIGRVRRSSNVVFYNGVWLNRGPLRIDRFDWRQMDGDASFVRIGFPEMERDIPVEFGCHGHSPRDLT
jgi:hypothetical protein